MPTFAAAVKCHAVDYQTDMNRLLSVPGNENPVFVENLSPAPVDNLTFKARPELIPGFVIR